MIIIRHEFYFKGNVEFVSQKPFAFLCHYLEEFRTFLNQSNRLIFKTWEILLLLFNVCSKFSIYFKKPHGLLYEKLK